MSKLEWTANLLRFMFPDDNTFPDLNWSELEIWYQNYWKFKAGDLLLAIDVAVNAGIIND